MNCNNKKITIIGMARSGIAAANFLSGRGAQVTLMDVKPRADLEEAVSQLNPSVQTEFGFTTLPGDADLIVLSPGVDIESSFLEPARSLGIPVWSELELAFRFSRAPVIAITGTNGKSTTTTLIGNILNQAGKKVLVGGNLGTPFISLLEQEPADFLVLEVSSFQLEAIEQFRPHISIILNISPDHLDRHKTLARYAVLKERIAHNQTQDDFLILNQDDPGTRNLGRDRKSRKIYFSTTTEVEEGSFLRGNTLFVRLNGAEQKVCSLDELNQVMRWQAENILAAALAAALAGVPAQVTATALKQFTGLEHRIEWVRTFQGIDFVNDSKGTNVGAVQKSLQSITRPVVLIAGGKDKNTDFLPLKQILKEKVKHLILIGETKTRFREVLNGSFTYEDAGSMEEAVRQAVSKAVPGDVVLLSPACASFDMFRDYQDRGNQFKAIVRKL